MSSVHRSKTSPFWICCYSAGGKRHYKSTKTKDKKQAQTICRKWQLAGKKAAGGRLTPDAAREIIAQGVSEIFAAGGDDLPQATTREWADRWIESKTIETAPSSLARYSGTVTKFLQYLGPIADKNIEHVTSSHIEGFRNSEAKRLSPASANLALKVIRAMLASAVAKQLILRNPAASTYVKTIDKEGGPGRRALTLAEIKRILKKADDEWRGLILFGLYTGQRLGDLSRLTWRAIDLENDQLAFTTKKTGRRIILPMAKPLRAYVEELPSSNDPDAVLFPKASKAKQVSYLSNGFRDLLADAGLVKEGVSHEKKGEGRKVKRQVSVISFHSLRHSAVTFLKASGASDVLAREIVGHDSAAISRSYTHLATEDLRPAIDALPDITK